jgi:small subunit ribosomal protein S16
LAEAERRLDNWMNENDAKIQAKIEKLKTDFSSAEKKQLQAELKVKEARATAIAAKKSELAAQAAAKKAAAEAPVAAPEAAPAEDGAES